MLHFIFQILIMFKILYSYLLQFIFTNGEYSKNNNKLTYTAPLYIYTPKKLTNNCSSLYLFSQNLLTILYTLDSVYQKNCRLNHKKQSAPVYIYYPAPLYIYGLLICSSLYFQITTKFLTAPVCIY